MIDGNWGVGKTHLFKTKIEPVIGEGECIYISLFGPKTLQEIENEIFKTISCVDEDEGGFFKGLLNSNTEIIEDVKISGLGYAVQFGLKTLVKSSITPWIITTRVNSTIFADSGASNLESPRFIMGMNKNDIELSTIVAEIKSFLKDRESITAITNTKDLENASQIFQINKQTRSNDPSQTTTPKTLETQQDEKAVGYLWNEEKINKEVSSN